jgi:hypothetical protein
MIEPCFDRWCDIIPKRNGVLAEAWLAVGSRIDAVRQARRGQSRAEEQARQLGEQAVGMLATFFRGSSDSPPSFKDILTVSHELFH